MSETTASLILGAILAIGGGWISDSIRAWRERKRELKAIKIALCDELLEIETTIGHMHEVWKEAKVLASTYIIDLLANTTAFDNLRTRLFLITNEVTRKKVLLFYKKLKDTAKKSEGKLGSLADTEESKAEQRTFDADFQAICAEAKATREQLK
jgi:hypothetical protein